MAIPWLAIIDGLLSAKDLMQRARGRASTSLEPEATSGVGGRLEGRLAGVMVAALKEVFDRDTKRLELERQRIEEERERAERAMRLEWLRQSGEREIGRLRVQAAVALVAWLGTLIASPRIFGGGAIAITLLAISWLLMLGALTLALVGEARISQSLARGDDPPLPTPVSIGLIVGGLVLFAAALLVGGLR